MVKWLNGYVYFTTYIGIYHNSKDLKLGFLYCFLDLWMKWAQLGSLFRDSPVAANIVMENATQNVYLPGHPEAASMPLSQSFSKGKGDIIPVL